MVALLEILFGLKYYVFALIDHNVCQYSFYKRYLCLGEIGSPHDSIILNR